MKQKAHISFTLNGEQAEVAFAPHKTLLEVLREDNRAIVRAASQASKAADYLLSFVPEPIVSDSLESGVADHETA